MLIEIDRGRGRKDGGEEVGQGYFVFVFRGVVASHFSKVKVGLGRHFL